MKRKRLALLLTLILSTSSVFAQNITIDSSKTKTVEENTYVPLRSLAEQLDSNVGYNNGVAIVYKDGVVYAVDIANKKLLTNNLRSQEKTTGDIDVELIDNSTYIPLETFSDIFDVGTSYDAETGNISISKDKKDAYSNNLKGSIDQLDKLIANTTDEKELAKLKEKRSLLYKTYLEYAGYVKFTGTEEEKKNAIDNVLKEIKNITGSSLSTSKPARTHTSEITGIGEIPKLLGIYGLKGYDQDTGRTAYIVGGRYMPTGRYYGGSVDFAIYANGIEVNRAYHNLELDTDKYIGKSIGLGLLRIEQPWLDECGIPLDVDDVKTVEFKTNIFGDFKIDFDETGKFIYGDPSYFEDVKESFLYFIDEYPHTTGGGIDIDIPTGSTTSSAIDIERHK